MYDGLLKLGMQDGVKLVTFEDDVAVVTAAKHLTEIK